MAHYDTNWSGSTRSAAGGGTGQNDYATTSGWEIDNPPHSTDYGDWNGMLYYLESGVDNDCKWIIQKPGAMTDQVFAPADIDLTWVDEDYTFNSDEPPWFNVCLEIQASVGTDPLPDTYWLSDHDILHHRVKVEFEIRNSTSGTWSTWSSTGAMKDFHVSNPYIGWTRVQCLYRLDSDLNITTSSGVAGAAKQMKLKRIQFFWADDEPETTPLDAPAWSTFSFTSVNAQAGWISYISGTWESVDNAGAYLVRSRVKNGDGSWGDWSSWSGPDAGGLTKVWDYLGWLNQREFQAEVYAQPNANEADLYTDSAVTQYQGSIALQAGTLSTPGGFIYAEPAANTLTLQEWDGDLATGGPTTGRPTGVQRVEYQIQAPNSTQWTSHVAPWSQNSTPIPSAHFSGLTADTSYKTRMRYLPAALDNSPYLASAWITGTATTTSVVTGVKLATPAITSVEENPGSLSVIFNWGRVDDAVSYDWVVHKAVYFEAIDEWLPGLEAVTSGTKIQPADTSVTEIGELTGNLPNNDDYVVRVRANGNGESSLTSDWSGWHHFSIGNPTNDPGGYLGIWSYAYRARAMATFLDE